MEGSEARAYRFAEVELYPLQGRLVRGGRETHLRQKSFKVLTYLVEHHDRLITKAELLDHIWRDTAVTEGALAKCIIDIRQALGDDSQQPKFVKNFPRVGYRFIHPVEELSLNGSAHTLSVMTEETTSVEIEYTESSPAASPMPAQPAVAALPAKTGFFSIKRRKLIAALVVLVVAVAAVYSGRRLMTSSSTAPETALPQVAGRRAVVVMPFDNQSNSQELAWLREGLPDMIITDLARAERLNVVSRQQLHVLLERTNHEQGGNVRFDVALDVARRGRAEAFILGSFAQLGQQIQINVLLHETESGRLIAAEQLTVDDHNLILLQLNLLTMKLAAHLGEPEPGREAKAQPAAVGTTNLEAFRYYSLGLEKAHSFENAEAINLLKKAVELDPQFAMAYARIGYTYALTMMSPEQGRPYLEKAFELSHRLTDKDRLHITAWYAVANQDYDGAVRAFREIIKQYPLESEAYLRLARLLEGEKRVEEFLEVIKQGLVVDPESKNLYNTLGIAYLTLGHFEQAIAAHQKYVQLVPKEPNAYDSLGLTYQTIGRYEEAIATYKQGLEVDPDFDIAVFHLANTYFWMGRYRDALPLYERYVELAPSDFERSLGHRSMAQIYLRLGKMAQAEASAAREARVLKRPGLAAFLLAVERGDFQAAAKVMERVRTDGEVARGQRAWLRYDYFMMGYLALKRGQPAEAIEHLQQAIKQRSPVWDINPFEDCLANAYLELGRPDEAIAEYERILKFNPNYPLIHYHRALAYERKGQTDQARANYEKFLQIWKEADADIPEVIAAKQALL